MDPSNINNANIRENYREFCKTHGFLQLIKTNTHVTKSSSSLIDHILTNSKEHISQSGVIETNFSDHFSILMTKKITRSKYNKHKTIKIRSFKNFDKDTYLKKLNKSICQI